MQRVRAGSVAGQSILRREIYTSRALELDVLRCQIRVLEGEQYATCATEATHYAVVRLGSRRPDEDTEDYAILLCETHAAGSPAADSIGHRSNTELRDHIKYLKAEPAF